MRLKQFSYSSGKVVEKSLIRSTSQRSKTMCVFHIAAEKPPSDRIIWNSAIRGQIADLITCAKSDRRTRCRSKDRAMLCVAREKTRGSTSCRKVCRLQALLAQRLSRWSSLWNINESCAQYDCSHAIRRLSLDMMNKAASESRVIVTL